MVVGYSKSGQPVGERGFAPLRDPSFPESIDPF